MSYEHQFLYALLLTLAIEVPIVVILVRYLCRQREINVWQIIVVGVIASALTLPYLWFILPTFIADRSAFIFYGETTVIIIEALIYNQLLKLKLSKSFFISLVANIVSVLAGLIF